MKRIILKTKGYFGVIIFYIILIVLSWVTVSEIETNIKNDVENSLKTVLNTTRIAFEQWKTRKESEILMFSKNERVLDITKRLFKVDRNHKSLLQSKEQKEIRNYFRPLLKQFGYIGIFVITKDSISLASMRDANVGIKNFIYNKRGEILKEVWDGKIKYIPPISSDVPLKSFNGELVKGYPTMFFAAPIFNEKNEVFAIFTLRINVFQNFTSIAELGRIGESGETYAVDKDGLLITRSRFVDQLVKTGRLSRELLEIGTIKITDPGGNLLEGYTPELPFDKLPLTLMAANVTSGNSNSNVEGYRDYRGVTVYGAWYWDDELGIGVTTEIDEEEAMSTFRTIKYAIIILILISIILTSFMLIVLNRTRKKSFDELKKAHDILEEKVIERTTELQATNKELEAFAYSVSHDLRAPLRGIDGFSKRLLIKYSEALDEKGKHYLERVRAGCQCMGQLIDDLLQLSRLTRNELKHEDVDLSKMANKIASRLQETNLDREVEFVIGDALTTKGDAILFNQAMENLLGNAWKYTSKNLKTKIEFSTMEQNGKQVFFVRDNGVGFEMKYVDKLFGAFQRLHSVSEFPGTGIGLAIVKRIIFRHGGEVWAEGEVDKGATFYFVLK